MFSYCELHLKKVKTFVLFFMPAVIVIFLTISSLEVVSKLLAPNVFGLGEGGDFHHKC